MSGQTSDYHNWPSVTSTQQAEMSNSVEYTTVHRPAPTSKNQPPKMLIVLADKTLDTS